MTTLVGAVLVIVSCGAVGISITAELSRQLRRTEAIRSVAESLRTEVCMRRLPLPQVLRVMEEREPAFFRGCVEVLERMADEPFDLRWKIIVLSMGLTAGAENAMVRLGMDLVSGEPPELAFKNCLDQLDHFRQELARLRERTGKLYPAAGFAVGCLAVIVLL